MQKQIWIFIILCCPIFLFAQNPGEDCGNAIAIILPADGDTCFNASSIGYVEDLAAPAACGDAFNPDIWYTFIVTGPNVNVTVTPNGGTPASGVMVSLGSFGCGSGTIDECDESAGAAATSVDWGFAPGDQVAIEVSPVTNGDFEICVTSAAPSPTPGNTCATATNICNTNPINVANMNGINSSGASPGCFLGPVNEDLWFQFTVGQTGTLEFTADINIAAGTAEFDWALFDITAGCFGTEIACNYNYSSETATSFGMSSTSTTACPVNGVTATTAAEFCPEETVIAGNTYAILIDNFSDNNVGFDLTWGGTFLIAPLADFTLAPSTLCGSGMVNFTNNSNVTDTETWDYGDGSATVTTSNGANPPAHNYTSPGTYLVTLTTTSTDGCINIASQSVEVVPTPTSTFTAPGPVCPGDNITITYTGSAGTAATYTWDFDGGTIASGSGQGPYTVNWAAGGNYDVTLTVTENGCPSLQTSIPVTINDVPDIDALGPFSICGNFDLLGETITGTDLTGNEAYYFDDGTGLAPDLANPVTANISTSGTYWAYDATAAPVCSDQVAITVTVGSSPTIDPLGPFAACDSYDLLAETITGTNLTGGEALYFDDGTGLAPDLANPVAAAITISGTYWIQDGTTGCEDTEAVSVTISLTPIIDPLGPFTACDNFNLLGEVGNITGTNLVNPIFVADDGAGSPDLSAPVTANITTSGTYWIYDASLGLCLGAIDLGIACPAVIDPVCGCDGITYNNSCEAENWFGVSSWTPGACAVGAVPAVNCTDAEAVVVTINNTPNIDPLGPFTACDNFNLLGETITGTNLTGNEAFYFDDGAGAPDLANPVAANVTLSGTYWMVDATGTTPDCTDSEAITITINNTPIIDPLGPFTACDNFNLLGETITGTNLTGNEAFYFDDGAGAPDLANPVAGNITISGTYWIVDGTGTTPDCSDSEAVTVTINLTPSIDPLGPFEACDSYNLLGQTIAGTNLTGNEAFYFDDGAGAPDLTNPVAGNITISGTYWMVDATGTTPDCSDNEAVVITINLTPVIDPLGPFIACDDFDLLAETIAGTNLSGNEAFYFDDGAGAPDLSNPVAADITLSGTYWIVDATGSTPDCADSEAITITINITPNLDPMGPFVGCGQFDLLAELANVTGANLVTPSFVFDNGAGAPDIANLVVGPITVSGTYWLIDATGTTPNCSNAEAITITINPGPVIDPLGPFTACNSFDLLAEAANITGTSLNAPIFVNDDGAGAPDPTNPVTAAITSTGVFWIYDETGTVPNCISTLSVNVTINISPTVDPIGPLGDCGSYDLLTNNPITGTDLSGNEAYYFDDGTGFTPDLANPVIGIINTTATVWAYDETSTTPNCSSAESFVLTISSPPDIDAPTNISACDSFDLATIVVVGPNVIGNIEYFLDDGSGLAPDFTAPVSAWTSLSGQYWVYDSPGGGATCSDQETFNITLSPTPSIDPLGPFEGCDSYDLLAEAINIIGTNLVAPTFVFDDGAGAPDLTNPVLADVTLSGTYWIVDATGTTPDCTDSETLTVTINATPAIDPLGPFEGCDSYDLLAEAINITGTNLVAPTFVFDDGAGAPDLANPVLADVTVSGTYWIVDATGTTPDCTDSEAVTVTINASPAIDPLGPFEGCDSYDLLAEAINITGTNLVAPTFVFDDGAGAPDLANPVLADVTLSGTYWIVDATGTTPDCTDSEALTVTINATPVIDPLGPFEGCDSYDLLAEAINITGTNLVAPTLVFDDGAGAPDLTNPILTDLTISGTYWIVDATGTTPDCIDSEAVTVTINVTPAINPLGPFEGCDSYDLLAEAINITGTNLVAPTFVFDDGAGAPDLANPVLADVTISGTYWIVDATGTTPDCTDAEAVTVTINASPAIDPLGPFEGCDSYDLLAEAINITGTNLNAPSFFFDDGAGAPDLTNPVLADVTLSGTYWIVDATGTTPDCTDSEAITVTINASPAIDPLGPFEGCDSYDLLAEALNITGTNLVAPTFVFDDGAGAPDLANPVLADVPVSGTYWIVDATGTIPDCTDSEAITVTINASPAIDPLGPFEGCDSYDLLAEALNITGTNLVAPTFVFDDGAGAPDLANPVLADVTISGTYWIVDATVTTPDCTDSEALTVTINASPAIDPLGPFEGCDSYDLLAEAINITGSNLNAPTFVFDDGAGAPDLANPVLADVTISGTYWIVDATGTTPDCIDSEAVTVTINVTPSIDPLGPFVACDSYDLLAEAINITGSNLNAPSFFFDDGAGAPDLANPVLADVTISGTYWIVDATGTTPDCLDSEPITVTINVSPVIDPLGPFSNCSTYDVNNIVVTGTDLVNPTFYFDDGLGAPDFTNPVLAAIIVSSTVWVYDETATIPNCFAATSFSVTIDSVDILAIVNPPAACDQFDLNTLNVMVNNPTGNPLSFYPDLGGGPDLLNEITNLVLTTGGVYWVEDIDPFNAGCNDYESFTITIDQSPDVAPIADIASCDSFDLATIIVTVTNPSGNAPVFYPDLAGNPDLNNPLVTNIITTTGTYWVGDANIANPSCNDFESFVLTIPTSVDAGIGDTLQICNSAAPVDLFSGIVGADFGGTWSDPGNLPHSGSFDAAIDFPGIYTYSVDAIAPCPNQSTTVVVEVYDEPYAGIDGELTACTVDDTDYSLFGTLSDNPNSGGFWLDYLGISHSGIFNPFDEMYNPGTYDFSYIIGGVPGCPTDTSNVTINLVAPPVPAVAFEDTVCFGTPSYFFYSGNDIAAITSYSWYFDDADIVNGDQAGPYEVTWNDPGTYTGYVSVTDALGCLVQLQFEVLVLGPEVNITGNTTIEYGDSVQLNISWLPATVPIDSFDIQWSPVDYLSDPNSEHPIAYPQDPITYEVSITDTFGCVATDTITIEFDIDKDLYVPNAFTPNDDGNNDYFNAYGRGVRSLSMSIYSRWGEKVFYTEDPFNDGWDGSFKGKDLPSSVFVYVVEGEYADRTPILIKGNLTLIR